MKTRYSTKKIKQNKKLNYKIFEHSSYNNIAGYNNYYVLTDYSENFIAKFPKFEMIDNYIKEMSLV